MTADSGYRPIADYGLIGDCRSAALVSRHGSIDWLCWPHFDSPSVFARILDARGGGFFAIAPLAPFESRRRYLPNSAVLETTFVTRDGECRLSDAMTVIPEHQRLERLAPMHELLRIVEGTRGTVRLELRYQPRPSYGHRVRLARRGSRCVTWTRRGTAGTLAAEVPLELDGEDGAHAAFDVAAGETRAFSLSYVEGEPAVLAALGPAAALRMMETAAWWQGWVARAGLGGRHRRQVLRSLVTLKLLTFSPSGAIVAAPTTSLPEEIAGTRNWDYRFCWIRDASLTLQALMRNDYEREADAFLVWLLHVTRRTHPRLQVLYDVFGNPHERERVLAHLAGYRDSRPVRIGNAAIDQLQLDIFGELIDAVFERLRLGGRLFKTSARVLVSFGEEVCRGWRQPDEGIWEPRSGRRHRTHSKVLCWVALDRLIALIDAGAVRGPRAAFVRERAAIAEAVERYGFDRSIGSYVASFGERQADAALLLLPRYGYLRYRDPRMMGTARWHQATLGRGPFMYRYASADGIAGSEGAFMATSFWHVGCLAGQGRLDEAREHFEALLQCGNDLGLFAEEVDPRSGEQLGNFPQAFSHIALADAAALLEAAECRRAGTRSDHPTPRFCGDDGPAGGQEGS